MHSLMCHFLIINLKGIYCTMYICIWIHTSLLFPISLSFSIPFCSNPCSQSVSVSFCVSSSSISLHCSPSIPCSLPSLLLNFLSIFLLFYLFLPLLSIYLHISLYRSIFLSSMLSVNFFTFLYCFIYSPTSLPLILYSFIDPLFLYCFIYSPTSLYHLSSFPHCSPLSLLHKSSIPTIYSAYSNTLFFCNALALSTVFLYLSLPLNLSFSIVPINFLVFLYCLINLLSLL